MILPGIFHFPISVMHTGEYERANGVIGSAGSVNAFPENLGNIA